MRNFLLFPGLCVAMIACNPENPVEQPVATDSMPLQEIAQMFAELPLGDEHFLEVHDAVTSSSDHGYDEEYTMADLFESPGRGVGESGGETKADRYARPLRSLISDYLHSRTRAEDPEAFITALESSDTQIYWPYSENWDGATPPVITFDPGTGSSVNTGYELTPNGVKMVSVDEEMARNRPVWVINRNDDAGFKTIEMLRREDPDWAQGGTITVKPRLSPPSKAGDCRTLVLRDFKMKRNFDPWFAGASEFFIKTGSVENFTASTEAELKLYNPTITDFVIVVRRSQLGRTVPFNAVLVSDWTDQLDRFAFMIVEDDGGSITSWKTSAIVKINSKSYGFELELPYRSSDDVVWRGQLSSRYFTKEKVVKGHFGDVELSFTFE